jgi:hypothetical protein
VRPVSAPPLVLRTASAVIRRDGNPYQHDDELNIYHRDLLALFGLDVDEDLLRRSRNIGFSELAEQALRGVPQPIADPDLLVLAYGLPDLEPLRTASAYLNHLMGGHSRSFAVSDQGMRSPFTALRIADGYARSGRCASLALFVCEQTTLPYHDPLVHDRPMVDSAALLYFDQGGDGDAGFALRAVRTGRPGEELGELLASLLAEYGAGSDPPLVVCGPWSDPSRLAPLGLPVHRAGPGTYCTGVWLELARHHRAWTGRYPAVVLCDTDPRTGHCHAGLLRLSPTAGSAPIPSALTQEAVL